MVLSQIGEAAEVRVGGDECTAVFEQSHLLDEAKTDDHNSHMRVAGVAELKARLSSYLASVRRGEEVTVTDRGTPIARLVPLDPASLGRGRLQELARMGLVRLPQRKPSAKAILDRPRPQDPEGLTLRAVLDEREGGW